MVVCLLATVVAGCGDEVAAEIDGHLDCAGNQRGSQEAGRASADGDHDTREEAIEAALGWRLDDYPEQARLVADGADGAIVLDGREVVVTTALEGEDGRWFTMSVSWCEE